MNVKAKRFLLLIFLMMLQITALAPFTSSSRSEASIRSQSSPMSSLQPKWIWTGSNDVLLSLTLGDFDGDQHLDVVTGASSHVFTINGRTGQMIWNNTDPIGPIFSLSVGNIDGDSIEDVIAGGWDRNVTVIQGATGRLLWKFGGKSEDTPQEWIRTTETADFNGDGIDDVIAGSDDWHIYCIDGVTGTLLWRRPKDEIIMNVPYAIATGDLDNDTQNDITIGDGSNVFSYRGMDGAFLWSNNVPMARVWSLLVADINKDRRSEVIAASADGKLYVFEGRTGRELWRFMAGGVIQSIALGDFNGDGTQNDILIGSYNHTVYTINGMDGSELWRNIEVNGWVRIVKTGDFTGDGISDAVIGASDNTIYIFDGKTAELLTTIPTFNSITELAVTDVEEDGFLELIFTDGIAIRCFTTGGEILFTESTYPPIPTNEFATPKAAPLLVLAVLSFIAAVKRLKPQKTKEN